MLHHPQIGYNKFSEKRRILRSELASLHLKYRAKAIPANVYYDQLYEIRSALVHLRLNEDAILKDPLECWCDSHPNDFECRIHDI